MGFIDLRNVSHSYGARSVLRDINLSLEEGEFVSIVGASASGKTTLLKIAAGLISPNAGAVEIGGRRVEEFPRDTSVVFQNYSLLPWLSALENVQLAVESAFSDWPSARHREQAVKYLEMVGLRAAIAKRPGQLSGGMRQRVAIARGFAVEPKLLFLDEPFGALDALTRATLQQELARLCQAQTRRATALMITNSVDEAILLSDRILALGRGPGASLSPAVAVDLPRPRLADLRNHDEQAVRLRARLGEFLVGDGHDGAQPSLARKSRPSTVPAEAIPPHPLEISSLTKAFPTPASRHVAVKDFRARVQPGEFVSLLGHSGCGKSTVLSIIAGLQGATEGGVIVDGKEIDGPSLDRALVFQSPSLLPWMSALDNVLLAARQAHPAKNSRDRKALAMKYLELVGVAEYAARMPHELSQGTQQRVSIARAFSLEPRFLLLDEPFGALDSMTRYELQDLLLDLWEGEPKTVILVTHDVDEALYLCDRILLMTDGPEAHLGLDLRVTLPRPRSRRAAVENPDYYRLRGEVIRFLEDHSRQFTQARRAVECAA